MTHYAILFLFLTRQLHNMGILPVAKHFQHMLPGSILQLVLDKMGRKTPEKNGVFKYLYF